MGLGLGAALTAGNGAAAAETEPEPKCGTRNEEASGDACAPPERNVDIGAERTNVLGGPLQVCSTQPMTGWFRDGTCRTDDRDRGVHVVCAQVTDAFLEYSKAQGNDLVTPRGTFGGLKSGDRWCLCAGRWKQAHRAGLAPPVVLEATHAKALRWATVKQLSGSD